MILGQGGAWGAGRARGRHCGPGEAGGRVQESECLALRPLEQAVLWRLLEQGPRFRPYDGEALRFYRERVAARVTAQMAQRALESLRERTPALVWKSARGEYAVDDAAMHRWFEQRLRTGRWPPQDRQGEMALPDDAGDAEGEVAAGVANEPGET